MSKRSNFTKYSNISLTQPAVRMVVVACTIDENEIPYHEILPVVALAGYVRANYSKPVEGRIPGTSHPALLDRNGWVMGNEEMILDPVFLCEDNFLIALTDAKEWGSFMSYEPIVCPWPAGEDAERLAEQIERIEQETLATYNRRKSLPV